MSRDVQFAAMTRASIPASHPALRETAQRHMQTRDWTAALEVIAKALTEFPNDVRWLLSRAQCLLALGHRRAACEVAIAARSIASADPIVLDALGSIFSQANDQRRAFEAYDRAVALAPAQPHFRFNRATVERFLGQLTEAEGDYDRVIELKPTDYEAYKNRSELRTQTPDANHVLQLERLLSHGIEPWQGEVQIRHALAKEHEDLGEYRQSFMHLSAGARLRREHMRYDVNTDVATAGWIIDSFPESPNESSEAPDTSPGESPIFIVGLPRSGTTLVDRILSSHSNVEAAGELDDLARCIVEAARLAGPPPASRQELIARCAHLNFAALGMAYLERAHQDVSSLKRFTDKMPLNYLYCGLIRRALPHAKIVHLTRHPMAACYAMYKTLFKDAYPFSYDLLELGRYYVAYRRLMDHWQASMPHAIHTVAYESLIADQRGETLRLLRFAGLAWEDGCLDFHRNAAPTTTASAAQVRQPLYEGSVSQWRHYRRELAPLARILSAAGIDTE